MRRALTIHPGFACRAMRAIEAEIVRPAPGQLTLHYVASGEIDRLRLPPLAPSARADDLWKHTCFELFARAPAAETYAEFNFAPSTQWAAYEFDRYREGMRIAAIAPPQIHTHVGLDRFELRAYVELPAALQGGPLRLALTAVIEETDGAKSYWALAHPPGRPDFHHADGFVLDLPETA